MLSFSFEQYFSPFIMLLVEGSSETGFLRHLSNDVFWSLKFKNTSGRSVILFKKCSNMNWNLENAKKKIANYFCFWDHWIWKCCYKFSLIRREYLLLALNGLTNSFTQKKVFKPQLYSQWRINVVKVLSFSFEKSCGQFIIYLFKGRLTRDFLDI